MEIHLDILPFTSHLKLLILIQTISFTTSLSRCLLPGVAGVAGVAGVVYSYAGVFGCKYGNIRLPSRRRPLETTPELTGVLPVLLLLITCLLYTSDAADE